MEYHGYQVYCKTVEEYKSLLDICKECGYGAHEYSSLNYMINNINRCIFDYVVLIKDNNSISGNYSKSNNYKTVTLDEFYKLIGHKPEQKGEKVMEAISLQTLGLAKSVEQTINKLGIKCLEDKLVRSLILKEGFKFGLTAISDESLEQIKSLVTVGKCEDVKLPTKVEEKSEYNDDLYDDCTSLEAILDDFVGELEDITYPDFDHVIGYAKEFKEKFTSFDAKYKLGITIAEIEAIIIAINAHKSRTENLEAEFNAFFAKVEKKYEEVVSNLSAIKDKC